MRISWLASETIRTARDALLAQASAWDDHFTPEFSAPPEPADWESPSWQHVTEHVARAERVSDVVRSTGVAAARARFGASPHAIELATVVAAAYQAEEVDFELLQALLSCEIDELVFYAPFLELLIALKEVDRSRVLELYERFCRACIAKNSDAARWRERVRAVRDGLASYYVHCGRLDDGDALFSERHREDESDLAVALTASRSFLAAGAVARSVYWLELGAARADELGRNGMGDLLREKQEKLRKRLS